MFLRQKPFLSVWRMHHRKMIKKVVCGSHCALFYSVRVRLTVGRVHVRIWNSMWVFFFAGRLWRQHRRAEKEWHATAKDDTSWGPAQHSQSILQLHCHPWGNMLILIHPDWWSCSYHRFSEVDQVRSQIMDLCREAINTCKNNTAYK